MYHEYNAVYLLTDGMFKRTYVHFDRRGSLSEALDGCKSLGIVSGGGLPGLSKRVGQPIAIIIDREGEANGEEKNELASLIANMDIYGKAFICGAKGNKAEDLDPDTIKELCNILQWEYRSKLHGAGRSKPKPQPKPQPKPTRSIGGGDPNAIYLHTDGMFKRTHVKFDRSRGMREALDDCTSLSVVTPGALTKLGRRVGESLAIVYDRDAESNGEDENELASLVAGATTVYGKAFLCGIDGDEPQELDPDTIKELCDILQWEYRSKLSGAGRSKPKPQPKPQPKPTRSAEGGNNNAVRLFADGTFKRTYVDFNDEDGPEHALNCSGVRKIRSGPLAKLSQRVGQTLTVFHTRDSAGQRQNELAARITGYDLVPGDAILCAYGDGYEPLKPDAIKALCDIIQLEYRSQGEQPAPKPSPKPASGKGDFGDYSSYRSSRDSRQSHPEPARKPQPAKETYYLELIIANFGMKKDVIAALQEIDGNISSWDAIQMMKNTPVVIRRGMTKAEADAGFDALSELGCNVKIQRE